MASEIMDSAVQLNQPSTSSMNLSSTDKLLCDLSSIVDNDLWSDIEVKVDGNSFPCHKNILAARSSYFHEKLRKRRDLTEMVERDVNADAFELVRRYIYTGQLVKDEADEELIADILCLSIKYKLDELTNFMTDQMKSRITIENAVKVFHLMSNMKMSSIDEKCLEFIRVHGENCLQSESYIALNMNDLVCIVKQANLSTIAEYMLVETWSIDHPEVSGAKLFNMLNGDIDGTSDQQYILINGNNREVAILNADTFDLVLTRDDPMTKSCLIAVCNGILYAVDTKNGQIESTPVASVLTGQTVEWKKCAAFKSSAWIEGNVAVTGSVIYFMDATHLWIFDTNSMTVTRSHEWRGCFYSLLELNGFIYCYKGNRFQLTDGINGWTPIVLPKSLGQYPFSCSLVKIGDSVRLVGGKGANHEYLSSVLCYDPALSSWTKGNCVNYARSHAVTVSLDGGRALLVGGLDGRQWVDRIELFDGQTKDWNLIDYQVELEFPQAVTFYA